MPALEVVWAQDALEDLREMYLYIASAGQPLNAERYVARIERRCDELGNLPLTGRLRPDIWPGARSIAFEGVVIIYEADERVVIFHVVNGARDYAGHLSRRATDG